MLGCTLQRGAGRELPSPSPEMSRGIIVLSDRRGHSGAKEGVKGPCRQMLCVRVCLHAGTCRGVPGLCHRDLRIPGEAFRVLEASGAN